jgi:hypothetical protein
MSWNNLSQRLSPTGTSDFDRVTRLISSNIFFAARVVNIILDENSNNFEGLGGWNALGVIEYDPIIVPTGERSNIFPVAYPFSPNLKNYPLINEIIYIMQFPNQDIGNTNAAQTSYYLNNISIWNHPHHNAYPSLANEPDPPQQKDYIQTQAGSAKIITNENKQIFLGKTFYERSDIHPLLPFEGDVIQEGRWGNSIRFGSTVGGSPSPTIINNWSETGINGDPITIIRNGQGERTKEGWIPITEDINKDNSSIYLTSTQKVPLKATSTNYTSYNNSTAPDLPNEFSGRQILLNSGRLVFSAGNDHILLSAAKSINLNSQNSVNIDTKDFIVQSRGNVYLGSYSATEPLLKGNLTVNVLQNLITAVKQLNDTFRNLQTQPVVSLGQPVSLDMKMRLASITLNTTLIDIEKQLKDLTSKNNFTI